jgi:N-acetylglucosaminyl-diphospho-decaprenol L-rhamnosyltransferase
MTATLEYQSAALAATSPRAPDLSVVIVTWNSERWIVQCLEALPEACRGLQFEVIVNDNASRDHTVDLIEAWEARDLRLIRSDVNRGFAAAVNQAVAVSSGRHLLLLNPDCVAEPGSMTRLVEHLDSEPRDAGAVPLLLEEDGRPQTRFQLRSLPTLRTLLAEILLLNRLFPHNRLNSHHAYREVDLSEGPHPVEQPAGAAFLLRREVYEEIGPLDERFFPAWFEDVDYCRRLAEQERRLVLIPESRVHHRGGASLDTMGFSGFLPIWYRNLYLYARKWMSKPSGEAVRWMIVIGMMLRIGAIFVGLGGLPMDRQDAIRTHSTVMKEAFKRWER